MTPARVRFLVTMGVTAAVLAGVSVVAVMTFEKLNAAYVTGAAAVALGLVGLTIGALEKKVADYDAKARGLTKAQTEDAWLAARREPGEPLPATNRPTQQ